MIGMSCFVLIEKEEDEIEELNQFPVAVSFIITKVR